MNVICSHGFVIDGLIDGQKDERIWPLHESLTQFHVRTCAFLLTPTITLFTSRPNISLSLPR